MNNISSFTLNTSILFFVTFSTITVLHAMELKESSNAVTCAKSGCDKAGKSRCSRCKKVNYCSVDCQRNDWGSHKLYCQPTQDKPNNSKIDSAKIELNFNQADFDVFLTAYKNDLERNFARTSLIKLHASGKGFSNWDEMSEDTISNFLKLRNTVKSQLLTDEFLTRLKTTEFTKRIGNIFPDASDGDILRLFSCLDYVIFKVVGFSDFINNFYTILLRNKITVNADNRALSYLESKGFRYVLRPQENDVIIYFDPAGKAIHFGIMTEDGKVISKPGMFATAILKHDTGGLIAYGEDVKFMRFMK